MDKKINDIPIRPRYGIVDEPVPTVMEREAMQRMQHRKTVSKIANKLQNVADETAEIGHEILNKDENELYMEYRQKSDPDVDTDDEDMNINEYENDNEKSFSYEMKGNDNQFFYTEQKAHFEEDMNVNAINLQRQKDLPQIDSEVLDDIKAETHHLAASVDNLLDNLCNFLQSVSSITANNVETHRKAVNLMTNSMDANIKCMYTIMAKTEEITKSMKTTQQLSQRIREIKGLVDTMENAL